MKIAVIGVGYVGLVSGVCFSEMGNHVICVDKNEDKIDQLNALNMPIYEQGLKELVEDNINKTLFFSTAIKEAIDASEIIFIAVGTPEDDHGNADLRAVFSVAEEIGGCINDEKIIVSKSTVPVGTTFKIKEIIASKLAERKEEVHFDVVSNPEFLKEGVAINDFMKPDRVVIGAENIAVFKKMKALYAPFFRTRDRFIEMDIASSEMTKYASNAILATKISFINEIANICEKVGADVNKVRVGVGSDSRVGYSFIYPGCGYGGSCFPKDVKALRVMAASNGYDAQLIRAVEDVNTRQCKIIADKIISRFGNNLSGLLFAVWGLSFKPGTDDMREAPSLYVIKELLSRGAKVCAYDPKAMPIAKTIYFKDNEYFLCSERKYEALLNADALILLTEWKEFRSPDFSEIKNSLKKPLIFDGRNQYIAYNLDKKGIEYICIGVG